MRLYLRESELDQGAQLLRKTSRNLRELARLAAQPCDLLDAELDVLIELFSTEGCDVSALRKQMGAAKQSLNRNLTALESKGLIRRDVSSADRRRRALRLTDEGRRIASDAAEGWRTALRDAYRTVGPEDVAATRRLIATLLLITDQREVAETQKGEDRTREPPP